jgi:hypothetical protein
MENLGIPFGLFYGHLVYFGPFGIFCGILVYYVVFWYILWYFVVFCGILWYFVVFWFISPRFGILDQEKSGNPDPVLDRFLDFKIRFSTGISQPKRTHTQSSDDSFCPSAVRVARFFSVQRTKMTKIYQIDHKLIPK